MSQTQPTGTATKSKWLSLLDHLRLTALTLGGWALLVAVCLGLAALISNGVPKTRSAAEWLASGNDALDAADYQTALDDYTQALKIDPDLAEALNNRAYIEQKLGRFDACAADYTHLIDVRPDDNVDAYAGRAACYVELGRWSDALKDFNHLVEVRPDFAPYFRQRGTVYVSLGDQSKALADFDKALSLDPRYPLAYLDRGQLRLDQGDTPHALDDLNQALALDPSQVPEAYYLRATIDETAGDTKNAIADYQAFLKLYPTHDTLSDKARARLKQLGQLLPQS